MGMVMGMKGTVKGCGSSWDRVIVMKGTSKGCGCSADGVMGRVIGIQGNCKGCGSCGNGVTGFDQIGLRVRTKGVVLGTGQ